MDIAPVTKRNRSTRYGCPRARGLRPSCHPRSARRPSWFAATCALLTPAHARRPACVAAHCARLARAHALRPACVAPTRALLTRSHAPRIQRRAIDSRPLTRRAPHPHPRRRPEGPGGTRGEALVLSDAETGSFGGAWNAQCDGRGVKRRESERNQCAGDEAQPIGAVRMSESTRASPLVPPALARGVLLGSRRIARC